MAEIDDVKNQIDQASQRGDIGTVARLSTRYRDLQANAGQLQAVGTFQPRTGREYQLATQAMALRRAGRENDAANLTRIISRERAQLQQRYGFEPTSPQEIALATRAKQQFAAGDVEGARTTLRPVLVRLRAAELERQGQGQLQAAAAGGSAGAFHVPDFINAGIDTVGDLVTGHPVNYQHRLEERQAVSEALAHAHPVSHAAGEVAGVLATIPVGEATVGRVAQGGARFIPGATRLAPVARASEIGAETRAAQLAARGGRVGQIARGGARAAVAGAAFGAPAGASEAAVHGQDVGQGAVEGAEAGAAGGVALRGAGEVLAPAVRTLAARFMQSAAVRQMAARLQEPVADLSARMAEFQIRMGHPPSAAEILGERSGRELGNTISGHGNAVETAIRNSTETQLQRPAHLSAALANGRTPVAAAEVNANASAAHTQNMSRLGPHQVSLSDEDLSFLTGRDVRGLFRGSLTGIGRELQGHVAARQALADSQSALVEATNNAHRAAQAVAAERARIPTITSAAERVRAKQALPAMERQAQRLVAAVGDARARAAAAAADVRPASMTLRQIEDLRTAANEAANNSTGPMYFMHGVSDQIRGIGANAGSHGAQYEQSLRALAAGKAQAEGVTAGRRVVSSGGQAEARAAARAEGAGPETVQSTRRGARQGVNTALQEDAGQGPRGMIRTATDLAENPQLQTGLREVVGPTEANRLQETGRVARDAAQSLQAATPAHSQSMGDEIARQTQNAMNAAVVLSGHTGGAFKAHWAARLASSLGITSRAAEHLAELAYNPKRSGEFVRLLAQYSGSATRLRQTMETLAGLLPAEAAAAMRGGQSAPPAPGESQPQESQPVQASDVSDDYLNRLAQIESGGNPDAHSSTSSATGLHQFTEATWLATIRAHAGDDPTLKRLADNLDDPQKRATVLALRTDPEISSLVARAFTADNLNALEQDLGREPTPGELYAAHFLGPAGAKRLIRLAHASGAQTRSAAEEFPAAARANRNIFYNGNKARSVTEVMQVLEDKWA